MERVFAHLWGLATTETTVLIGIAIATILTATVVALLAKRASGAGQPAATPPEAELDILWRAMDSHAMVNISDSAGRVVYVNDTFVNTTGYDRSELIGRRISDFLLSSDSNNAGLVRSTVATGATWNGETQLRRKDGSLIWTRSSIVALRDSEGRVLRTISLRTDITESKLRQAEAQNRALLDKLRDEVIMFAADDLRLLYINRRACELHGWSEAEYRSKTLLEVATNIDLAKFRERARPLLTGEVEALTFDAIQHDRPVEINLQLDRGFDGRLRFIAVLRDITRRRLAETARAQFVATVSHELRSPLTSVMGALKLVTSGTLGPLADKPAALLSVAQRNVDRVVLMINDLLDLEKLDAGKMDMEMEPVDLSTLVEEALDANLPYAGELGVRLVCKGADSARMVLANHGRLIQVLNNLLSNAAKFSRPGGVVEVEIRGADGCEQIIVRDSGIGIPKETQARLFERFVQTGTPVDSRRRGSGLGLSIAKAIVERHGGAIRFTSEEGVGTTFCIDLPKRETELLGAA